MFNGNGGWGDFNGNGGSGESNGNGGCGGFNGGAVSDEEEEEAQDFEVFQEPGHFDDSEPFWVNGDVEEMWNLFDMNEIKEIQQIIGNRNHLALNQMEDQVNHLGLQQIVNNENHLGQAQIVHNVDHFVLPQLENNGGLPQNIEEQLYMEDDPGLLQIAGSQQPQHVVHGSMDNLVNLEWLDILTSVGIHEPEPSGGSLAYNGVNVDFNGLGESDEDEQAAHFGEIAELEPEALEDLGPYWVDDVDNGQEQWNLLNMDPPPDEFFDGVDNDIQGMLGGED